MNLRAFAQMTTMRCENWMLPKRHAFSGVVRDGRLMCICGADMEVDRSTCTCGLCENSWSKVVDSDDDTEYNTTHLQTA